MLTEIEVRDLDIIIKGINKGSFCKANTDERFVSLAHFVTLQSMECIKLTESYMPNGYSDNNKLFIWLPTPDKSRDQQAVYVRESRALIARLLAEVPNPTEITIDLRCNIGGVLSVFIDAILPFVIEPLTAIKTYMHGKNMHHKVIADFNLRISNSAKITHVINVEGDLIESELQPAEPVKCPRFNVLCNRYTMSSGEILCMLFRYLGELGYFTCKLYGEKTRGLTNGCVEKTVGSAKIMVPVYYLGCGDKYYINGIADGILPMSDYKK
jgi:hypothetical protein